MQVPGSEIVSEDEIRSLTTQNVDTIANHSKLKLHKEKDRLLAVITPGYYLEVTEHMDLILAIASRLYKGNPPTVEVWEDKRLTAKFYPYYIKKLLQSSDASG